MSESVIVNGKQVDIHEKKIHGMIGFPYIVYMGKIPEFLCSFPLHWHEELEIIWIKSGTGYFRVHSENYLCNAGDIIIIPPNYVHDIRQKESEYMEYFNILFKFELLEPDEKSVTFRKYFEKFLQDNTFKSHLRYGEELNSRILPLVEYLVENRHEKYESQELMIKAKLFEIMHCLQATVSPLPSKAQKNANQISRLKPVLKYSTENYGEDISIEAAAEMCSLSPSHFMKFFKKMTGMTYINYLNKIRLENALTLLKTTDLSISQIADQTGFRNFSYFIRSFKAQYGITPGKLKQTDNQPTV